MKKSNEKTASRQLMALIATEMWKIHALDIDTQRIKWVENMIQAVSFGLWFHEFLEEF